MKNKECVCGIKDCKKPWGCKCYHYTDSKGILCLIQCNRCGRGLTDTQEEMITTFIRVGGIIMKKYAKKDGWYAYAKLLEHFNNLRLKKSRVVESKV